jgi:hypothetical protein
MTKLTLKQYLKPNTAVRPPVASGECWTPPAPSRGKRHFKFASRGSGRGAAVIDDVSVESEAIAERVGQLVIRARPETVRIVEQSPQVPYVDGEGVERVHTFDLLVFRIDNTKAAIDFKPSRLVERSGIREMHKLIARQITTRTANVLLVMTEKFHTPDDRANATLMHTMARQEFPKDDETILKLIRRMKGPAPIADLVKKSKLHGYGFNAVVRAIADGHLRMTERCRIDYPAIVAPVRKNS